MAKMKEGKIKKDLNGGKKEKKYKEGSKKVARTKKQAKPTSMGQPELSATSSDHEDGGVPVPKHFAANATSAGSSVNGPYRSLEIYA